MFAVDVNHIDGKLHKEHVDGFAGNDPEALSAFQTAMFQQARFAGAAGFGNVDGIAEERRARDVADLKFQTSFLAQADLPASFGRDRQRGRVALAEVFEEQFDRAWGNPGECSAVTMVGNQAGFVELAS